MDKIIIVNQEYNTKVEKVGTSFSVFPDIRKISVYWNTIVFIRYEGLGVSVRCAENVVVESSEVISFHCYDCLPCPTTSYAVPSSIA